MLSASSWARQSGGSSGVLAGQLAQAAVNFVVMLASARSLPAQDFAQVSVAWIIFASLLNAQRVIVGEQILITSIRSRLEGFEVGVSATVGLITCLLYITLASAILVGVDQAASYGIVAVGALALLNDALRYAQMAQRHFRRLLVADLLCGSAAFGAILVSFIAGHTPLSWAFALVGAGVALSILLNFRFPAAGRHAISGFLGSMGGFVPWSLAQLLLVNTLSQFSVLLTLPFLTSLEFAGLRAIQALMGPLSTPATALQPLLLGGITKLERQPRRFVTFTFWWALGAILLFGALATVLGTTASYWLPVLLSPIYVRFDNLIAPVVLTLSMVYVGLPFGVRMRVARLGKDSALAQLSSVLIGALSLMVGSQFWGASGAAWATVVQATFSVVFAGLAIRRYLVREGHRVSDA
jgi:hypothetical protein